jgi:3-methylcrotonyl-CoA carboxylase alpha subunit
VIEEAPAPGMSAELRASITDAAVACAKAVRYEGVGTVEFLVEGGRLEAHAPWYFIEMNTRLQVEHPVTEAITGLDLVEWQLRVASGEKLPLAQSQIGMTGHAIEARLNAEDPTRNFLPSTGPIVRFAPASGEGLRVDAGVKDGSVISPFYDSMIAKLIAHGADRPQAIARLSRALEETVVAGPRTSAPFLHALLAHPTFAAGEMDTGLIGRDLTKLAPARFDQRAIAAGVTRLMRGEDKGNPPMPGSPWEAHDAFQLGPARRQRRRVLVDGTPREIEIAWERDGPSVTVLGDHPPSPSGRPQTLHVVGDGNPVYVLCDMRQTVVSWPTFDVGAGQEGGDENAVRAPIIGRVAKVFVTPGATVAKGDRIAVVEAMKMEHVLHAPRAGRIDKLAAREGDQVAQGALIAALAKE